MFVFVCGEVGWENGLLTWQHVRQHVGVSAGSVHWQHLCDDVHKQDRESSLTHTPLTWITECFLSFKPTHAPRVMNVVAHTLSAGNTQDRQGHTLSFYHSHEWHICKADVGVLVLTVCAYRPCCFIEMLWLTPDRICDAELLWLWEVSFQVSAGPFLVWSWLDFQPPPQKFLSFCVT